jgi:acyl transferase domain-containing protein
VALVGVQPSVLVGHSVEIVAACVAGVFGLDDARPPRRRPAV